MKKRFIKFVAFMLLILAIFSTFKFVDERVIITILIMWLTFSLMCLGVFTTKQTLTILKRYKR